MSYNLKQPCKLKLWGPGTNCGTCMGDPMFSVDGTCERQLVDLSREGARWAFGPLLQFDKVNFVSPDCVSLSSLNVDLREAGRRGPSSQGGENEWSWNEPVCFGVVGLSGHVCACESTSIWCKELLCCSKLKNTDFQNSSYQKFRKCLNVVTTPLARVIYVPTLMNPVFFY